MINSIPGSALKIMEILEDNCFEAYLVGGCVRDLLLGKEPDDYDITTNATPDEILEVFSFAETFLYGKEHGTISIAVNKRVYEVTTYRIDGTYSDNRRPDSVSFTTSLKEDVLRRDFTINAIAMDRHGRVIDFVNGKEDLENKVIRSVGDATTRYKEDALRILRAVRFKSKLGFAIDPSTEEAVHSCKSLLGNIAIERVREEFDKILLGDYAEDALRNYRDVIAAFIPEIEDTFDFDQKNPFHCYDVYEHTIHAVANTPKKPVVRLAAFFHDIGKPSMFFEKDGVGHFYNHEAKSRDIAENVMRELRYGNKIVSDVLFLVREHGTVFNPTEKYARRKLNQMGEERLFMLIDLEIADVSSQAFDMRGERIGRIKEFAKLVNKVIEEKQCFNKSDMLIDGNDLISLGYPKNAFIGKTLDILLERVVNGEIPNDREELLREARARLR